MDVVQTAKELSAASGAAVVGACWAIWSFWKSIKGDLRDSKQQAVVDQVSNNVLTSLQSALTDALANSREEREKSEELSTKFRDLGAQVGRLQATLEFSQERRNSLEVEVKQLKQTIEDLVLEIRNKDRSINQLVDINKKLLVAIGGNSAPSSEKQKESTL